MTNTIRALQSAIETIENANKILATFGIIMDKKWSDETLNQCKAALSEIEKCEPVGELILDPVFLPALKAPLVNWKINLVDLEVGIKFYTSPQPRDWVGLSYDEIESLYDGGSWHEFANAISEKLKQLNTKG